MDNWFIKKKCIKVAKYTSQKSQYFHSKIVNQIKNSVMLLHAWKSCA